MKLVNAMVQRALVVLVIDASLLLTAALCKRDFGEEVVAGQSEGQGHGVTVRR
jgi:hypothetical protein